MSIQTKYAAKVAALLGVQLLRCAGDGDDWALAAAAHNAQQLREGWCNCQDCGDEVYWRRPNGSHGWMCEKCCRITQCG